MNHQGRLETSEKVKVFNINIQKYTYFTYNIV
jgi:hypothetical protein